MCTGVRTRAHVGLGRDRSHAPADARSGRPTIWWHDVDGAGARARLAPDRRRSSTVDACRARRVDVVRGAVAGERCCSCPVRWCGSTSSCPAAATRRAATRRRAAVDGAGSVRTCVDALWPPRRRSPAGSTVHRRAAGDDRVVADRLLRRARPRRGAARRRQARRAQPAPHPRGGPLPGAAGTPSYDPGALVDAAPGRVRPARERCARSPRSTPRPRPPSPSSSAPRSPPRSADRAHVAVR